jgi:putative PIG3 family NAD(P)H quinone oxidoreductase
MRAVVVESPDQLAWREVPDAQPAEGEVLIKVSAAGLNRADLLQAAGYYPPPPGASEILGLEVSGVIAEVGPEVTKWPAVTKWSAGQKVCALLAGGGYAEYVAVPAPQVMPLPDDMDLQQAAALPEVACTVWSSLVMTAGLSAGQTLLVHGGASGVGSHAIQVGHALGVKVAVTAGSAAKLELARELGADITINYKDEDFVARVQAETGGADVILDIIGAAYLDRNVDALALDGRLVIIGLQGGTTAELNLGKLHAKRGHVIATALRSRPVDGPAGKGRIVDAVVRNVWPMIGDGRVRPVIGAVFPVEEATSAHKLLASGDVTGKVLLRISD